MLSHSDIIDDEIKSLLATLPGFRDYQERFPDPDLESLLTKYEQSLRQSDKLTYGIRTNIKLIKRKYNERRSKASESSPEKKDENGEFPAWAALMTSEELGNIYSLTNRLPALAKFLQDYSSNRNFTEVISLFEEEHMKELRQQRPMRYIVDSIKKYFQSIMEKRVGALHFVSTEHCVNDKELLQEFFKDAKDNFFSKDLSREDCQDFLLRYIHSMHPYIDAEIGNRYLKYGQYKVAFVFYTHIFRHIFSSPNLYWHNPEGIYGCASTIETIVNIYYDNVSVSKTPIDSRRLAPIAELCYLLASRIVYWDDLSKLNDFLYVDEKLPIRKQDKIHFYSTRVFLLEKYPFVFHDLGLSESDISYMLLADLYDLHQLAHEEKLVGENSLYLQKLNKLITTCGFNEADIQEAYNVGKERCDNFAYNLYVKYTKGEYCLNWEDVRGLLPSRMQSASEEVPSYSPENIPFILYNEREVNYETRFKKDRKAIHDYLVSKGIKYFYHFTERNKLPSIIKQGGIISYKKCLDLGIVIPSTGDMSRSRDVDASFDLQDYVRVSYCRYLPKIAERKLDEDKDWVLLRISTEVAELEETLFTDMEATQKEHHHGAQYEDLLKVNIEATQRPVTELDPEFWQNQAEVMIKDRIPMKYILNITNPENL